MKIAVVAFEGVPRVGTEAGLAWHWGTAYRELGHEVEVLTQPLGVSSDHLPLWHAHGIEIRGIGASPTTSAPHGIREMIRNFVRYRAWIKLVTTELQDDPSYDLVHQVSLSSIRLPWVKPHPQSTFILGPVGGAHIPPWSLLLARDWIAEGFRAVSIPVLGLLRAFDVHFGRRPDLVYTTNRGSQRFAEALGLEGIVMMLTDGISSANLADRPKLLSIGQKSIMWAGRMVASKRPDLALEVLDRLRSDGFNVTLTMVGDGPELGNLRKIVESRKLGQYVEFLGRVPWEEVVARYETVDALLFTSVRDSSCPGVLEAAACGRPSIVLRHQGVGALVPESVAFGPDPQGGSRAVVEGLVLAGHQILGSSAGYTRISKDALRFAATQVWALKAESVLARYWENA